MAFVSRRQGVYNHTNGSPLDYPLLYSNYKYMVQDIVVDAVLTESYKAHAKGEHEVSYLFEVPPEASVLGFSANVGGTLVEGIVEETKAANKHYKEATTAGLGAWELKEVNEEVFQIHLGKMSPNSTVEISIHYSLVISSDITDDSTRLTIPCGLQARPGTAPAAAKKTIPPAAPTHTPAVTITVGIHAPDGAWVDSVNTMPHNATITNGYSDSSFKSKDPNGAKVPKEQSRSYVEFTSEKFLVGHFVVIWSTSRLDHGRCIVEQLAPPFPGPDHLQTQAFALSLVSKIDLEDSEHEYLFLVDRSGSMQGHRTDTANHIIGHMLDNLPVLYTTIFNIFAFENKAWSILGPNKGSIHYDADNLSLAKSKLNQKTAPGGTKIAEAVATVLKHRTASKPRCSIILVTDGLDWNVKSAMEAIRKAAVDDANNSRFLRVFVMGLGDNVSRGMCEGLARVGSGATAYVSDSTINDEDHWKPKADELIRAIRTAPIRVTGIDWGVTTHTQPPAHLGAGAAAKGDNLPPPPAIQQSPNPGTLFWSVRSTWFAIINGAASASHAKVTYDVPGKSGLSQYISIKHGKPRTGRVIHSLAARSLIQTFEDSMQPKADNYKKEAEVIRLGKNYGLASTQTSFVAIKDKTGVRTKTHGKTPPGGHSPLLGTPVHDAHSPNLSFVKTKAAHGK